MLFLSGQPNESEDATKSERKLHSFTNLSLAIPNFSLVVLFNCITIFESMNGLEIEDTSLKRASILSRMKEAHILKSWKSLNTHVPFSAVIYVSLYSQSWLKSFLYARKTNFTLPTILSWNSWCCHTISFDCMRISVIHMSRYLSFYLSIYLSVNLSANLPTYLFVNLPFYYSLSLSL